MAQYREVMNVREASQYLGVSKETLYKYLTEQSIPAFKLGSRWRLKKNVLDRWMEKQSRHKPGRAARRTTAN
ncbi:MAG TPA: helix-turn-helix domain-containing protein [Terriglobia bacterium]|nr:helix-turn-helix domain-containing protein [Terriglobia bacterium]